MLYENESRIMGTIVSEPTLRKTDDYSSVRTRIRTSDNRSAQPIPIIAFNSVAEQLGKQGHIGMDICAKGRLETKVKDVKDPDHGVTKKISLLTFVVDDFRFLNSSDGIENSEPKAELPSDNHIADSE